jgi:hypothetical protein
MNGSGDNATAVSLYELFFELEDNLCHRYKSLNPFDIRREKVGEVFLLVKRINRKNQRENGIRKDDEVWFDSKGNKHIRRKAQNDDWY